MTDELLDIATAHGVKSKKWKNQKLSWSEIEDKLLTPHRTNETYKEFVNASKTDQLKIKDVGGYVGGYLRGGRRKPENVVHRQLITLDIDEAHLDFWLDFQMSFDNAAVIHGTHKHSEKTPRYRLVMPLSREVSPDEYMAVARYVAGVLGIDYFDNTTFQTERLMFWPSSSKDVEYYAESQKGPWLDVDDILENAYVDWTDSSSWPTSSSEIERVKSGVNKQEDPQEKKGLIGGFCRTYTISEAIDEFLSEEYTPAGEDRYTYVNGSAGAGLVVYDDKFAYSHHGTDPTSGQLCNAFDLVRIHKFGHLDSNQRTDNVTSLKSYKAMTEFCTEDKKVVKTIALETVTSAKEDFGDFAEEVETVEAVPVEEYSDDWLEDLEYNNNGQILNSAKNINLIFNNDPMLSKAFTENEFDKHKYVLKRLPSDKDFRGRRRLREVDLADIRIYIEMIYKIVSPSKIEDALRSEFSKNSYNPVKDYLDSLVWDKTPRVNKLLVKYLGAKNNAYSHAAIRKPLVAAVARIYNPGTKFDLVLTLVGAQGTGKSTFIKRLGVDWFSDSFHTVSGKEAFEQLKGAWVIEMAELSGVRKSEVEQIKHFITKTEDQYRPAYARVDETYPRQCVFFATTNERDFLRDPSGNRRFMPVDVEGAKIEKYVFDEGALDREEIDQIWAEAVTMWRKGEKLYLDGEAEKLAKIEREEHTEKDDREGLIVDYLERLLPEDWDNLEIHERRNYLNDPLSPSGKIEREVVSVAEVWCECLGREKHDLNPFNARQINNILRNLEGWEFSKGSRKNIKPYGQQRYYSKNNFC